MHSRINIALGIVLAAVVAVLALHRVDPTQPNYQIIIGDDMTFSPAYGSYEPNENFPNGRTMQPPVPGTLARGAQPFHYDATPEEALRAGEELVNPFEPDSEERAASADRGRDNFQIFCAACHNGDGAGNGPVAQRGFPPPASLLTGKSRTEMKDGQLLHILTYGQNSMPTFAVQLTPERRWDLINHIRRLQKDAPPIEEAPPTEGEPVAEGEPTATDPNNSEEQPAEPKPEAEAEEPSEEESAEEPTPEAETPEAESTDTEPTEEPSEDSPEAPAEPAENDTESNP